MRYSIIHHDVRKKFNLTLSEYLVADSINKLSRLRPCSTSDAIMAEFLGLNRTHVWECKKNLLMKGLIKKIDDAGFVVTDEFYEAVTFVGNSNKLSENPTDLSENPTHTISNRDKLYITTANAEGETTIKEKKDTTYVRVFELWGKYPLHWKTNRTEIQAAKNLLAEHGLEDCKEALDFYKKHKHEEFCPQILKPSDLDRKRAQLMAYNNKI